MRSPILVICLAAALTATVAPRPRAAGGEEAAEPGGWVSGVVQRLDGTPVEGARLALYPRSLGKVGTRPMVLASAESGAAGEFRLGPLPTLPHLLRLNADVPDAASFSMDTFVGAAVVVRLLPVGSIRGRVLCAESGKPLPDLPISVGCREAGWWGSAKSGADGAFLIERVPEGTCSIEARIATVGAGELERVPVFRGRVTESEIWVAETPELRGTVRGIDGKPIGGASVWFEQNAVTTAEDGSFRVRGGLAYQPRPEGEHKWTARASAPGMETSTLSLVATRGCPILERSFTLRAEAGTNPRSGATRPSVAAPRAQVTRGGKAVAGALVSADAADLLGLWDEGGDSTDGEGFVAPSTERWSSTPRWWARAPDGALGVADALGSPSNPPGSVMVPVEAPATLTGTVAGPHGKAEPGATVRLFGIRRNAAMADRGDLLLELECDSSGAWRTPWVSGAFIVEAEAGTARSPATRLKVAGSESKAIALTLATPSAPDLTGHVVDDSGAPLEGAYIWDKAGNFTSSARNGSFRLPGTGGSLDSLRVEHPECIDESPREVTMVQGGVKVVLRRGGEIRGRIVSAGDGAAVRFAWVFVQADPEDKHSSREAKWQTVADGEGRFRIRGLRERTFSVFAVSGDRASDVIERVSSKDRGEIRLELRPGGTVTGTARDGKGKPLPRETIVIEDALLEGFKGNRCYFRTSAESDDAGEFRFVGLPAGVWLVTLPESKGHAASERRVTLAAGETRAVSFVRAKPGVIKVQAVDTRGRPIHAAEVSIETAEGVEISPNEDALRKYFDLPSAESRDLRERCERTGRDGVACWPGLEPGKYTVRAIAGFPAQEAVGTVQVREGDTTVVKLVLK